MEREMAEAGEGKTQLVQTALFVPKGLSGTLYWYCLYPIHRLIFSAMVRNIARAAEELAERPPYANSLSR